MEAQTTPTSTQAPTIAIVDDDQSVCAALSRLVRALGYGAIAFERGEDLLQSDAPRKIVCLITDLQMPGIDGIGLHRRLTESGTPVPTILITAHHSERMRALALQEGFTCYLAKPVSEEALLACLNKILGNHGCNGELTQ